MVSNDMIIIKSPREIEKMRHAGTIVASILQSIKSAVKPGMSTLDIDKKAEKLIRKFEVKAAFKGYRGFKHCICTSLNDEVVHGIPSAKRILKEGDIISLDFGVIYDGYYGDSAITIPVGDISAEAKKLIEVTEEALKRGISAMTVKNHLHDISSTIQEYVESAGFSVVRDFVGHGIGQSLHEDPPVPNYGEKDTGVLLKEGMVLALEPMVNVGRPEVHVLDDGWTAVTKDNKLSAHFEHTIAIGPNGPEVLTSKGEANA